LILRRPERVIEIVGRTLVAQVALVHGGAGEVVISVAVRTGGAAERETQEGHVLAGRRALEARQVDADQTIRREHAGRLFEHLADHALLRRLLGVEVAGRVVQLQAFGGVLLDQQEAARVVVATLDHRRDGDTRFPAICHAADVILLALRRR